MRAHTWGDDVDDVDDDDDDDDGVDDEDKDVEEWGGRWRDCDAYTPRIKKNNQNYLNIMYIITILLSTILRILFWPEDVRTTNKHKIKLFNQHNPRNKSNFL